MPYSSFSYSERWEQKRQARTFISQRVKWRRADAAAETPADGDRRQLMTAEIMKQLIFHYYKHVTAIKIPGFISSFKSLAVNTETTALLQRVNKVRGFQLCQMCPCVGIKDYVRDNHLLQETLSWASVVEIVMDLFKVLTQRIWTCSRF